MRPPSARAPVVLVLLAAAAAGGCGPDPESSPDLAALERVEAALAGGHYGEARRELAGIRPDSLRTAEARMRLARASAKAGDHARAAAALEEDPSEEARLLRIEGLIRSGSLARAKVELSEMERAGRKPERWQVLFALASLARGERGVLQTLVRPLVEKGTRDLDAHLQWAGEAEGIPELAQKRLYEALGVVAEEDRPVVLKALGRLLLGKGEARRAADHLERAVERRPWDRDARLELVRAWRRIPDHASLERAEGEARRMLAEEPRDMEVRIALAEVLGQRGILLAQKAGGNPAQGAEALEESIRLYEELLAGGLPDGRLGMELLLGLARAHVELVPVDSDPEAEDSHLRKALSVLDRVESLDPAGRVLLEAQVPVLAEVAYLRARAWKRSHAGTADHTRAVGYYEKALGLSAGRHLEANWDLGLLFVDFLRKHEWLRKALDLWKTHIRERERRGLPPLDPQRQAMVHQVQRLVDAGSDLPPGVLLEDALQEPAGTDGGR